jgi:hypothetical protein
MKKLYDDVDWSLKKAGERLTTGLLERNVCEIPPERRFVDRSLFRHSED